MPAPVAPEEKWMALALKEAQVALSAGEDPVGAVILDAHTETVRARAHQQTRALTDPTAHAVMIALTQWSAVLAGGTEEDNQDELTLSPFPVPQAGILVTTREPCVMCAGALLLNSSITKLVFGVKSPTGACGSALNVFRAVPSTRSIELIGGILEPRCAELFHRYQTLRRTRSN